MRSKTDWVDATMIERFCATQQPPAWTPPAVEVQELQALVRRVDARVELRTMERNRRAAGELLEAVRLSIESHLAYLQAEIRQTEQVIRQHIRQHVALQVQTTLLLSIDYSIYYRSDLQIYRK